MLHVDLEELGEAGGEALFDRFGAEEWERGFGAVEAGVEIGGDFPGLWGDFDGFECGCVKFDAIFVVG